MNRIDFQIFATIKIAVTVNIWISTASESTQAWANSIFNHINSNLKWQYVNLVHMLNMKEERQKFISLNKIPVINKSYVYISLEEYF